MLPSIQNAGLSVSAPVAAFVSATSQMSRPSWLLPIERSVTTCGSAAAYSSSRRVSSGWR
jgi:hypothetical protein